MLLLPPSVVGPLSECSLSVRVQGQLTGSKVRIYSGGRPVAEGIASWSDQLFPLFPGESLKPGEEVVATQDDGSGPSPTTPEPFVRVLGKAPTGPLSLFGPPYGCGQAAWIKGAFPGAIVTAKEGAVTLGSGEAPGGEARLFLSPPINSGGVLLASQEACGLTSADTPFPPAPNPPAVPPAPVVGEPLRECGRAIRVSGVLVGALVTIERSSGVKHTAYFDYPNLIFNNILPPLSKGEVVTARQEFPVCQLRSPDSKPVTVGPNTPVPIPVITTRVCIGGNHISIGNLNPGSKVKVFADGVEIGLGEAPAPSFIFPLPPLKLGQTLTARQELCGIWSDESNGVRVLAAGYPAAVITEPLVACGGLVHCTAPAGSWVMLHSTILGGEIGRALVLAGEFSGEVEVPVAPLLIVGDSVFPLAHGCSVLKGKEAKVQTPPQDLNAPGIGKVSQFMTVVPVTGVVPGARVEVFVNGVWRGSDFCSRSFGQIAITDSLQVGNQITARQSLCNLVSPLTSPPVVVEKPPVAGFTASTKSGEVPLTVNFTNTSTGAITKHAWDFESNGSVDSTATNPSHTYSAVGSYTAKLTVEGPGGTSSATESIQVMPMSVGFEQIVVFNCHAALRSVHLWTRDATAGATWIDQGELPHHYDRFGYCPVGTPKIVALTDKHIYEVVGVDTGLVGCPGNDPSQVACRRFYTVVPGKKGGGTVQLVLP